MDRSAPTNGAAPQLEARVRRVIAEAVQAGEPIPGRRAIAKTLGAREHHVRPILTVVERELQSVPADHPRAPGDGPAGRWVARGAFVVGSLVSVAANILSARIGSGGTAAARVEAEFIAPVFPIILIFAVELMARVRWPAGWVWLVARFGGVGAVALGSALISYGHISDVLTFVGYSPVGARVGPVVIDGIMTLAGFAMLATASPRPAQSSPAGRPTT